MRLWIVVILWYPALVLAQANDTQRGNTPPGMSQDSSGPADGAVKGGSIMPGEGGGVPNKDSQTPSVEHVRRCDQLQGTLREDCLARQRSAAGGSTAPRPRQKEVPPPE